MAAPDFSEADWVQPDDIPSIKRTTKGSDAVLGLALTLGVGAYMWFNQVHTAPPPPPKQVEAMALDRFEAAFKQAAYPYRHPSDSLPWMERLDQQAAVALVGQAKDPWLWPNMSQSHLGTMVGGCPLSENAWAVLLLSGSVMTQLPAEWPKHPVQWCMDVNGSEGPNTEGKDVVWVTFDPSLQTLTPGAAPVQ